MGSVLDEFQFHRPLVACTLIGFILGDMKTGIIIGGTLEMIATGWMNIGAAVAPDAATASIISTILVIAGGQSVGAGIATAIPLAAAGGVNHHRAYPHRGLPARGGQRGGARQPARHHRSISAPCCCRRAYRHSGGHRRHLGWHRRVHALLNSIPEVVTSGLNIAGGMIVVVGYAMVINMMRAGYLMPFFYLGFVTAAFTNFNWWRSASSAW